MYKYKMDDENSVLFELVLNFESLHFSLISNIYIFTKFKKKMLILIFFYLNLITLLTSTIFFTKFDLKDGHYFKLNFTIIQSLFFGKKDVNEAN